MECWTCEINTAVTSVK